MSRIGKLPFRYLAELPLKLPRIIRLQLKDQKVSLNKRLILIQVKIENGILVVERPTEQKRHKACMVVRSLLNNMIIGVSSGYTIQQELVGVGYKAEAKGQILEISLDSHMIFRSGCRQEVKVETKPNAEAIRSFSHQCR